jgi:hypothetical protein
MVFNATFNNISVILWQSVLLVEETGVPGENHWPVVSYWLALSHNVMSPERDSNSHIVVIGTDCISSCIFHYHTITTTMAEQVIMIYYDNQSTWTRSRSNSQVSYVGFIVFHELWPLIRFLYSAVMRTDDTCLLPKELFFYS